MSFVLATLLFVNANLNGTWNVTLRSDLGSTTITVVLVQKNTMRPKRILTGTVDTTGRTISGPYDVVGEGKGIFTAIKSAPADTKSR